MPILLGVWWFVVGVLLVIGGLYAVWRAEQNKWLSWLGFHRDLPWYSLVAVIISGLITSGLWYFQPEATPVILSLQSLIVSVLCVVIISDLHFSVINLFGLAVGTCAVLIAIALGQTWVPSLASALSAALIAIIFFLWQYLLSRGQWVGMGDAWLGAWLGLLVGWHEILIVAAVGYACAALTAFILIVFFKQKDLNRLPLGAFLSLAALAYFLVIIVC